jgi:hypothetical protein
MARRLLPLLALSFLALAPAAYAAISQTPDITDTRYSSDLRAVEPSVAGVHWHVVSSDGGLEILLGGGHTVSWRVIDVNDEIRLINRSDETVIVYGYSPSDRNVAYDGGQYARILPDGAVQVNENSPAYYLDQSFFADYAAVPASATVSAPPDWVTLARTGSYTWHDHRIHYTSPVIPQFIKNRGVDKRQFVFDWYVPIEVGSTPGYLYGQLFWNGEKPFSFPIGAIVAFVVVVAVGVAFVIVVRRRRRRIPPEEAF